MQQAQADCYVDELVELVPALAAEAFNGSGGGGEREWDEEQPGEYAYGDEAAFGYVLQDGVGIEASVEADVGDQVDGRVEEGEKAEQAAEFDEEA